MGLNVTGIEVASGISDPIVMFGAVGVIIALSFVVAFIFYIIK